MNDETLWLGKTVKDKVTGFTGVATGYVQYLTGCNQVLVAPKVKEDGSLPDSAWFDEQRLEVEEHRLTIKLDNTKTLGPDKQAPKR